MGQYPKLSRSAISEIKYPSKRGAKEEEGNVATEAKWHRDGFEDKGRGRGQGLQGTPQ